MAEYYSSPTQQWQIDQKPEVLLPGRQLYREFKHSIRFDSLAMFPSGLNLQDTIRVDVAIQDINNAGYMSSRILDVGWLKLDSIE